jgi:hypothetical protein
MNRTAVLNVVGLTESLLGERTPRITAFRKRGAVVNLDPAFPAARRRRSRTTSPAPSPPSTA